MTGAYRGSPVPRESAVIPVVIWQSLIHQYLVRHTYHKHACMYYVIGVDCRERRQTTSPPYKLPVPNICTKMNNWIIWTIAWFLWTGSFSLYNALFHRALIFILLTSKGWRTVGLHTQSWSKHPRQRTQYDTSPRCHGNDRKLWRLGDWTVDCSNTTSCDVQGKYN